MSWDIALEKICVEVEVTQDIGMREHNLFTLIFRPLTSKVTTSGQTWLLVAGLRCSTSSNSPKYSATTETDSFVIFDGNKTCISSIRVLV